MGSLFINKTIALFKGILNVKIMHSILSIIALWIIPVCNIYAQNKSYSFNFTDITLGEAIRKIEKETNHVFFYNNSLININRIINVKISEATIEQAVQKLLPTYRYKIENKKIIILPASNDKTGQDKITIKGLVIDESGKPIIGASINERGTINSMITDLDGNFSLNISPNSALVISYIGFITKTVEIKDKSEITIILSEDPKILNEVVVVGYGTIKKQDLTGSVVNVKMADIKDAPVTSIDQSLQGRIAGVDVMSTTGEPGAVTSIRIRGTRSISATNEPLIVVDGVMDGVSDIADINPADIASISVLKDASSTAIYGSRGSNGVIIITTQRGQSGKPHIVFKSDIGISELPRNLDLMNGAEFAQFRNDYEYFISGGTAEEPFPNPLEYGKGTDWVKEITKTALYQNYSLSLSGGSDKTNYFTSLSFNNTQGIIKKSGLKRYTGRLNIDHQLFPWLQIGYRFNYTYRDQDVNLVTLGGTNWWNAAIYLSPLIDSGSDFNNLWYAGQKFNSPLAILELNTHTFEKHITNNTAHLEFEFLKNLKLRTQGTYYKYETHRYRYEPGALPANADTQGGIAYRGEYKETSLLSETTVMYKHSMKSGHNFDVMAGFTAQTWKADNLTLQGVGYQIDDLKWNNMGAIPDKQNYSANTNFTKKAKMSLLARFNYNYKERYYLTLTGRRDGASNFARNHKWGFFPSGALKWNVSNESFMKDIKWLSQATLRLSAGRTGNDGISSYRSLASMTPTTGGYLFNGKQPVAYYPSRLASNNLTWEKTDLYNLAIDLSFFNNRINMTAEGYISYTKDVLLYVPAPTHTGYSSRFANIGKTSNKGIELSIETRNITAPNFSWTTAFTLSHNRQMVKDIGTSDFVKAYSAYGNNSYMMYGYVKDYPLNALWGFKYGGTWKNQEEVDRNEITKAYVSPSNAQKFPGSARYLDINHDGVMNENDLVYLGSADPWLHGGIQNNFHIGNFIFRIYFNYSLGGKIYNISEQWMGNGSPYTNQYRYMTMAWHPTRNPESDIPRAGNNDAIASDRMVYDASYLRFKNLTIGYKLDLQRKTRNVIKDVEFSISADNIYLWKKYNGFDPDISSNSSDATLRRVDIGAYPKPRTIVFSLQIRY